MISQKTIEEVRNCHDIVRIISDYIPLKQRGRNHIGLCPFHNEKTPSFTVSQDKGIFHCFGCHESGDHISFVMKIDHLSFHEAIRHIAAKKGIEIIEDDTQTSHKTLQDTKDTEDLKNILYQLRQEFKKMLTPSTAAYRYLISRGLTDDTLKQFHLGFCPSEYSVTEFLKNQQFSPHLFSKTGILIHTADNQWMSRMKGRITFPIIDHHSRTVGFGGRIIDTNKDIPKYINSEESPLFNKRRLIYGLDQAKKAIKDAGIAIIVEGYMDVITAHQFGFKNTIACMGTALTIDQARLLKRYTDDTILALDSDTAGQQAIDKSYPILKEAELNVKILQCEDKDPADLLISKGAEAFQKLIDTPISMIEFKYHRLIQNSNPNNIDNIPKIIEELLPILHSEKEVILRKHYIKWIALQLKIDSEIIVAKLQKNSYNVRQRLHLSTINKKSKYEKAEEVLVYLMATDLTIRKQLLTQLEISQFSKYQPLVEKMSKTDRLNRQLLDEIDQKVVHDQLARVLVWGEQEGLSPHDKWQGNLDALQHQEISERINILKTTIKQLELDGKDDEVTILLQELQALIQAE